MPGWQKRFEPLWKAGKIQLVGVVQEQYADRARLYAQWRGIEWPILVDSQNLYGIKVVPIPLALDEAGCVVIKRIRGEEEFDQFLAAPKAKPQKRTKFAPPSGDFQRGVEFQKRSESAEAKSGDAQRAVEFWQRALASDPNQYIWRRRLQQYGPRLAKPYNFYGWIEQARKEIKARGEEPLPLRVEPLQSETLDPRGAVKNRHLDPDPDGKIAMDTLLKAVSIETVMIPRIVRPGMKVRVRFICRIGAASKWNDEGEPLTITLRGNVSNADLVAEKGEVRTLECDLVVPEGGTPVLGYALYDVCTDADGTCQYLRQAIQIVFRVDSNAQKIR